MIPAAIAGTRTGRAVLARLDATWFLVAFRLVLGALALKLIVIDGLAALFA